MTDKPYTPEPCDHHWKWYLQPKNVGLSWIRQCSQCGDFDTDNLREQVAAAEQRGAVRALREAAKDWRWSAWTDAPRNPIAAANYTGDWIENRADRIADKEGDDE